MDQTDVVATGLDEDELAEVAGGGTAVAGGDDIVFAPSERMAADGQLLVVPEAMSDDVLGGE